jgi:hypothetical protein
MLEWTLKPGDPANLTLAADVRTGPVDYTDDHIWELVIGRSEPPAVVLQTTFGTRARGFRIFPRFGEGDLFLSDPAQFRGPITVQRYFPNYARLSFTPLPDLEVMAEYWVATSQSVCGRLHLHNLTAQPRQVKLELVCVLNPDPAGARLSLQEVQAALILTGKTENLAPVVFLKGGSQPASGPFPCLSAELELPARGRRTLTWGEAALSDTEVSFALARASIARKWEAELARLEQLNFGLIEIRTGDPAWDHVFSLSQTLAFSLLVGPTPHLPAASFVTTRQPNQGHSLRGDGQDYGHLWNGQSPLDALYLSGFLLPAAPELVRGLLQNFLSTQRESGEIDHKPGLGGQRSLLQAAPLLASLAWRVYEATEDLPFLQAVYPQLIQYLRAWFSPSQDRDRDGIPEWEHLFQVSLDDHPLFAYYHGWAQGLDPHTVESPDLCALLHMECLVLQRIARLLHLNEDLPFLQSALKRLKAAVESTWSEPDACYHYRDRDTHETSRFEVLGSRLSSGNLVLQKEFASPVRLTIHIDTEDETTRRLLVFLHGSSPSGAHRIERLSTSDFTWSGSCGHATSERIYITLEHVEMQGLKDGDRLTIASAGLTARDQTNLLPLWGRIPAPARQKKLVEKTIMDPALFWKPYGIPPLADLPPESPALAFQNVHLPWNELIGEGLLACGYRAEAAELLQRLMKAVTRSLEQQGALSRFYQAETGLGIGERNALPGLAPVRLFLETLGVQITSPKHIFIQGFNPFPWPVTVKYRGTTILRHKEKTTVVFPDGQTVTTDKTSPVIITLE